MFGLLLRSMGGLQPAHVAASTVVMMSEKLTKKRVIVKLFKLMDKTGYPVLSDPDNP
jgi:hypothetical protein